MTTTPPLAIDRDLLHRPGRADHMLEIEDHITTTASLTRAVWLMMSEGLFGFDGSVDPRNRDAVQAVASAAADHASAAEALLAALPGGLRALAKERAAPPAESAAP